MTKKKTYMVTMEEIRKYEKRGYDKAIDMATLYSSLIPLWVLRNDYGFGAKRLEDFTDKIIELTQDLDAGRLSIMDIKKTIEEETGLIVRLDKDLKHYE